MLLLMIFILVPVIEIGLFIKVGGAIGISSTLLIVVVTAILGTFLVKKQGALALLQVRSSFGELRDPSEPLAHGAMILFSGALLLTPGFFTDAFGFLLLIPQFRSWVFTHMASRVKMQSFTMGGAQGFTSQNSRKTENVHTIDGDYEEVTPSDDTNSSQSDWTQH